MENQNLKSVPLSSMLRNILASSKEVLCLLPWSEATQVNHKWFDLLNQRWHLPYGLVVITSVLELKCYGFEYF